jgi:hypothetical protein
MKHLYEITADMQELRDMLESDTAALEDIEDTMQLLELDFQDKVLNSAKLVKQLQHDALACKVEGNRLLDRGKRLEKRITWLQDYLCTQMLKAARPKLHFPEFDVSLRTAAPAVFLLNENKIPDQYREIVKAVKFDRNAIKKALQEGEEVPGAELLPGKKWLDIR